MDEIKQGSRIIVRGFGGVALVRRLWEYDHRGVFVHDDEQFDLRQKGEAYLLPVGFSWVEAYVLPEGIASNAMDGTEPDWTLLTPLYHALPLAPSQRRVA